MVWIALAVFFFGSAIQVWRFFMLSRKVTSFRQAPSSTNLPVLTKRRKSLWGLIPEVLCLLRHTVYSLHPITMTVSTLFHACLLLVPLFLLGHNELIAVAFGISLPSLPEWLADGLTLVFLACGVYFLIRRMALARMRAISTWVDYLMLFLAIAPFLSGFLAYHQIFNYRAMITIHMLSGELMLIAIPFTKLTHMTFFFFSRFLINNEHTLGRGKRVWQ